MPSIAELLRGPVLDDESLPHQVYPLYSIVSLTSLLTVLNLLGPLVIRGSVDRLPQNIVMLAIQVAVLVLLCRGHMLVAGYIFITALWTIIHYSVYQNNGILNPSFAICAFCIVLATLIVGERAGFGFCILSITTGALLVAAAQGGLYATAIGGITVFQAWSSYAALFIAIFFVVSLTSRAVKTAFESVHTSQEELRHKNKQLEVEIAERQRLLTALEESETRWRFALEGSGDGVWDWNGDAQTEFRSKRYSELLGYNEVDTTMPSGDWASRIHPDDWEETNSAFQNYMSGAAISYEHEYRIRCSDNNYKWVMSRGKIMGRTADGKPIRVVGTVTDISARKQLEEDLRSSESAYRHMFEDNPNPMWVFDTETRAFLAVNDAAVDHYGYSESEFLSMTIDDVSPADEHANLHEELNRERVFFKSNHWHHLKKDGSIIDVEIAAHQLEFQGKRARLVLALDVTERYRAQEALRHSENLFSQIFHAVPLAIGIATLGDGRIIKVNNALVDLTEYQSDELVGRLITDVNVWADMRDRELFRKSMVEKGYARGFEGQMRTKDGALIDVLISAEHIEIDGEACILAIGVDVRERLKAQQQLLEAERLRLEAQSERELSQLKERFISGVSHEFRTPLTVILSSISTVSQYYDRLTREQQMERFGKIEKHALYLSELLDDVLMLSKARSGQLTCVKAPVDVVALCQEIFAEAQMADTTVHQYCFVSEGEFTTASLDPKLLQHILFNLLTNAMKYSPPDTEVKFSVSRINDQVVIKVSDCGIGIPADEQQYLFQPFFRSSNAKKIKGTGLGLTIVQESVYAHGGSIAVHSQPGDGTTFIVTLPGEFSAS